MASEHSITESFDQLTEYFTPARKRVVLGRPPLSREHVRSHLKKKLYTSLFSFFKDRKREQNRQKQFNIEDIKCEYSWLSLVLRKQRRFDDADRLETILQSLNTIADQESTYSVLLVLLKLKDTGGETKPAVLGYDGLKLPLLPERGYEPVLPEGPLSYGDTRMLQPTRFHYMHYPSGIFGGQSLEMISPVTNLCEHLPGSGVTSFFRVEGCLGDQHELNTTQSLFGGLVHGKATSLDVQLGLPELPDTNDLSLIEFKIPKSASMDLVDSYDEGFKSQEEDSLASSTHDDPCNVSADSVYGAEYDLSIYDTCFTEDISHYYTWETLGMGPGHKIKPHLTEAGPVVFDHLNKMLIQNLSTAFPSLRVSPPHEISLPSLISEVLNVMRAVPSINFMLDMEDQCFTMREGLYVSGISAECLHNFMEDFLTCGMYFYRIGLFAATPVINSFYKAGVTFQAFTGAVQSVLHYYNVVLLSLSDCTSLIQLRRKCHKLIKEMRFLACLCHCNNPVTEQTKVEYPTGIQLLTYLYNNTVNASFGEHYPLMLSVLKRTCTPYLQFIQDWVYHGIFKDIYGEFMIKVNEDYLMFKDKHYWTQGYTLGSNHIEESVPPFLKEHAKDIFLCGKSINLLRACNRDHFLCDVDDNEIPNISLTFSKTELSNLSNQCVVYANKMQQISRQLTISLQEARERAERARHEVMVQAIQKQAAEMKRLEDKILAQKQAVAAKKKKELMFLKSQMEDDLKRRAHIKETTLQEEKDYMDSVINRENVMNEEELELERQTREEMIAYYSQLSEEATQREQKALWRIRRAKLDIARTEFLLREERLMAANMEKYQNDSSSLPDVEPVIVKPASPSLPRWAVRGLEGPTIEVTGDDEDNVETAPKLEGGEKNLPKWALKGLEKYGISKQSPDKSLKVLSPGSEKKSPTRRNLNASFHVSDETEQVEAKPSIQTYNHMHATSESTNTTDDSKSHVKRVEDQHASKETTQDLVNRPHIKTVSDKHINQESGPQEEARPHIRSYEGQYANKQSEGPDYEAVPKMKLGVMQSTTESKPMEWKIKEQNVFGHVSQMSTYEVTLPKLKKSSGQSASRETDWSTDYCIKPKIRINRKQTANTESEEVQSGRTGIKFSDKMSATKESEYVDYEQKRVQMFKERNVYGHATDSSVERLLYVGQYLQSIDDSVPESQLIPKLEDMEWITTEVEKYPDDDFDILDEKPLPSIMMRTSAIEYGNHDNDDDDSIYGDIEGYQYLPLSAVIKSSIISALEIQVSLVNENLVRYFISELKIEDHFMALRRYLCMGDGDFSEILCDLLMERLGTNPRPQDIINPIFLNNCLNKAVRLSVNADDKLADNVSFIYKYIPRTMEQTAPDVFDCIQLHYEVKWPLNIVITDNGLYKYSQVFSFMLQLKRVVWILKDVWNRLKRDALVHKVGHLFVFRELHLYRQKMQIFVKAMQEYISHQIVDVTWQEFQTALSKNVHNLDDLHSEHNKYLDTAIFRCLLTKKASSLMKIIQDIFHLILMFHRQLVSGTWNQEKTHTNYAKMKHTYKIFHEHSTFLFKVVHKLADRGYQPHLHDLLLRLNFNHYYDKYIQKT